MIVDGRPIACMGVEMVRPPGELSRFICQPHGSEIDVYNAGLLLLHTRRIDEYLLIWLEKYRGVLNHLHPSKVRLRNTGREDHGGVTNSWYVVGIKSQNISIGLCGSV